MAVGCGAKCAKAVLIIFNLIFWLSGCALAGLGVWLLIDEQKTALFDLIALDGHEPVWKYLAYGLIGLGGFILLVGIIGCCGALQESKCLLVTYFITLFLVLGGEVTIGVFALLFRNQVLGELQTGLTKKFARDYENPDKAAFTKAVDFTQFKFKCCGIVSFDDYKNATAFKQKSKNATTSVPADPLKKFDVALTCCKLKSEAWDAWVKPIPENREECMEGKNNMRHDKGCKNSIQEWIKEESLILIAVGLGVAGLEVFGMIFALCLCCSLGESEA